MLLFLTLFLFTSTFAAPTYSSANDDVILDRENFGGAQEQISEDHPGYNEDINKIAGKFDSLPSESSDAPIKTSDTHIETPELDCDARTGLRCLRLLPQPAPPKNIVGFSCNHQFQQCQFCHIVGDCYPQIWSCPNRRLPLNMNEAKDCELCNTDTEQDACSQWFYENPVTDTEKFRFSD